MSTVLLVVYYVLQVYFYVLIAYILLSWIPDIRGTRFYEALERIADPYMRIFRGVIVIGQMDFTPIIGFILYGFILQFIQQYL